VASGLRRPRGRARALLGAAVLALTCGAGLAAVHAAEAPDEAGGRAVFVAPVPGEVTRAFDPPDQPWLAGHRGVDLRAQVGQAVLAAGSGRVAFAGVVVDRPVVSIDHPGGLRTTYEPVNPAVVAGQEVRAGEEIGTLDAGNGHCDHACVHWGARTGPEAYIDPLGLLHPPRYRLYRPEPW